MDALSSKDGVIRLKARKSLVLLGKPAVPTLSKTLLNSQVKQVRWEAAKTLGAIGDARAIPSLVHTLKDADSDIAWLAAEALEKFKKIAWLPLLRLLVKSGADSAELRQRAHHVFRDQRKDGFNDLLVTLRTALKSSTVPELTTVAAHNIIKRMKLHF
jgi:HEAT repeat protein